MNRDKIDNALQNERKKYLDYESNHDVTGLESLYLRIAKEIPEDLDSQPLVIAMEECGELSQAIAKGIRGKADVTHLAEEIADVSVIIDYVKLTWGISDEDIQIIRALKLEQLEGIVTRLQTEYQSKLSPLNMMNAFTTLREMTYEGFLYEHQSSEQTSVSALGIDVRSSIANAFVEVHWRTTPQIIEDGLDVLKGTLKTMKIRAKNLLTYIERSVDCNNASEIIPLSKFLWAVSQIDILIWITAMVLRRFNILNAWVGDDCYDIRSDHFEEVSSIRSGHDIYNNVHKLVTRIEEFIDYGQYNNVTVFDAKVIRTKLNDVLNSVIDFEVALFHTDERIRGDVATWNQLKKLVEMMKRGDEDEGGTV